MRLRSVSSLALLALLVAPEPAHACSCVQVPPAQAMAEHDAVFEGRVLSVEPASDPSQVMTATLEVVQHWKGVETEQVTVSTAAMESVCGVSFEVGTSWLVYADVENGALRTGLCSRTRRIEEADEDLAELGADVVLVEVGEDDEVEAPAAEPPARGGCASCTIGAPGGLGFAGLSTFALLALALVARRRPGA